MNTHNNIAIIPAAGSGSRMGFDKILTRLNNIPLLVRTVRNISASKFISAIIVVVSSSNFELAKKVIKEYNLNKVVKVVCGGKTRTESVWNALKSIETNPEIVLIHDGARPFVSADLIYKTISAAAEFGGAIVANKVIPTIKEVDSNDFIRATIDRNKLWAAATPQTFRYKELLTAYQSCISETNDKNITDDAQIFELTGRKVKIIEGPPENIKLTTPLDWKIAETILNKKL